MDRKNALYSIQNLVGQDLRELAERYQVTVRKCDGKINKGWAGHVVERHLGLPLNSAQAPNFGSWELKVVPLKRGRDGALRVKETMAITMIDPVEVALKEFEDSHVYRKLRRMIVVSRVFENQEETASLLHGAAEFDLDDVRLFAVIKADYELARNVIRTQGFGALSGKMGQIVQPRTKGPGHGSISRAFYARPALVAHILNMDRLPFMVPVEEDEEDVGLVAARAA